MKHLESLLIVALCSTALVGTASAHVTLTYPVGGETFAPGSHVKIEWQLIIEHDQQNWDLYFSADGGATWTAIQEDLPNALRSYDWTVPDIETTQAKIKIVQDNTGLDYTSTCAEFEIQAVAAGTEDRAVLPESPSLLANYPNPFTSSTSIEFALPRFEDVSLKVFDVLGQEVATLSEGSLAAGSHVFRWQPSELSAGIYILRLETAERVQTLRIVRVE